MNSAIFYRFCLPFGKVDDTPSPSLPRVRGRRLQLHPRTPWIWGILNFRSFRVLICLLWAGSALTGCADRKQNPQDEFLIKVGTRILTVADFNKAFEVAKAAYSYKIIQQPEVIRNTRLRLVRQMTEEMILLERAKEIGVTVTAPEVEKALADIKGEYPDDEFQKSLIENAVPYPTWKEALKRRLLIEKVVAKDLGNQIHITPDDISTYYKAHMDDTPGTSEKKETEHKTDDVKVPEKIQRDAVVKILRQEKLEKAYIPWIETLKNKYRVEINKAQLQKLTSLKNIRKSLAAWKK